MHLPEHSLSYDHNSTLIQPPCHDLLPTALYDANVDEILATCPGLTHLDLRGCSWVAGSFLVAGRGSLSLRTLLLSSGALGATRNLASEGSLATAAWTAQTTSSVLSRLADAAPSLGGPLTTLHSLVEGILTSASSSSPVHTRDHEPTRVRFRPLSLSEVRSLKARGGHDCTTSAASGAWMVELRLGSW